MTELNRSHDDLVSLLSERAARHPDRLALRFLSDGTEVGESWTYGQLHEHACALAGALRLRADAGQRAFLLYPNGPAYVQALLGCLYAGIVAVPAFPPRSLGAQHIERIVSIARDAQPSLLLTEQMLVQPLDALRQTVPALRDIELLATDRALDGGRPATPSLGQGGERLALLQYTSGSTATPKGVMLTHANLMANQRAIEHAFGMREDDVVVSWLPLFHDMGLIGTLLQPLYQGATAVLFSPQQFMERPERWLEAVSRFRGTVSGAPDFAYRMCVNRADPGQIGRLDLRSWRLAFCGAEPVRHETLRAFADTYAAAGFDRAALYPCYGLAEATLLVTGGQRGGGVHAQGFDAQGLAERRALAVEGGRCLVGCGQVQPGHQVLIADPESGEPLPTGQVGEIWASGPSIAQGYWQNPEATQQTFARRGERTYLRTGDLGFEHGGELFVAGREKDVIIVRGQNIYPQDIERSVEEGVSVLRKGRIAAFSVEIDGREGIGVAAEVSPRVQRLIEPDAVCRAICERVAQAHGESPSLVLLLEAGVLPITSSGKLQRAATRAGWQKGSLGVISEYQPELPQPISS
jgi:acyl-CoA synthetase (AMP-forming)/AMP-acid ligase II